jgi:hypothetical protein
MKSNRDRHRLADNYIVRIYRRDPAGADGIVEVVSSGAELAFHGRDDLWAILSGHCSGTKKSERQKKHQANAVLEQQPARGKSNDDDFS